MTRPAPNSSSSQRAAMLDVLRSGDWVPLPRILELHISQYGARIHELRRLGYRIENKAEQRDGKRCTAFRLVSFPAEASPTPPAAERTSPVNSQTRSAGDATSDPAQELLPFGDVR
jgi:hypothetical protein